MISTDSQPVRSAAFGASVVTDNTPRRPVLTLDDLAQPLTPNFLEGVRGLSLSEVGMVFTAGALGNALVSIFLGRFPPRIGYPISQALVGLFALLMWRGTGLPWFALGFFLLGGFRAARPLALAQARELIHDSQMGLTYGMMETVTSFIFILTPPLAGYLYERDPYLVYPITIGLILLSMLVSIIFAPHPPATLQTEN